MLTTEKLILIRGDVKDAGEFKGSKQYIASCALSFDEIKVFFDQALSHSG